MVKTVAV